MSKWRVMADVGSAPVLLTERATIGDAVSWLQEFSKGPDNLIMAGYSRFYPYHTVRHFDIIEVQDDGK